MANFLILTNNPSVADKYPDSIRFCDITVSGIFTAARDAVHAGARLISHPLAGSLKPNESPYKSIVLSTPQAGLDFDSLQLIEGAIAVLKKLPDKNRVYGEQVLDDFRVIDLDLMNSAMMALPAEYHT